MWWKRGHKLVLASRLEFGVYFFIGYLTENENLMFCFK